MSELVDDIKTGEHETHRAVSLSNTMQILEMVKQTQSEVNTVSRALRDHMDQEAKDRQVITQELNEIKVEIEKIYAKVATDSMSNEARIEEAAWDLRRDMNSEVGANITSLKVELKRDIERVAHQLERFSDNMKQEHKDSDAKFIRIFERLEAAERNQAANNQWIDLGKRVAYAVAGAVTIGILVAIGLQLK